jgi:hypothetical protein
MMLDKPAGLCCWTSSRQDPPGYEQKPHTRPTTPGERAADREAEPEDGAQVDVELGRGQITCLGSRECINSRRPLFGEISMRTRE